MDKKVEKELQEAQDDIKDALDAERDRSASISSLEKQSVALDSSLAGLQEESHRAKNRLWRKSIMWVAFACVLVLVLGGIVFLYVYNQIKQAFFS
ncbi:uncharacterized protein NEMAJ01_2411 [Nematocida major]|uniref:uncharacterized protein n=1 Tax=Nematocida major TaxID=1912982 RepID=UPI002007AF54|nr:uncharacterized protein NEMAJ01_2411 [Nematocida major]KAH9387515.1 hypothetical protein NEMAJ01_2411 [Nematocida major]